MQTIGVERNIWINAPRERVWEAITDPQQIKQWFSPGVEWRGTGLHVGATFSVYDTATGTDMFKQVIEVVDPPRHLVTRTDDPPEQSIFRTIYTLTEEDGGTRLVLTHSGYESMSEAERAQHMEQNGTGFGFVLDNIKALVEGTPLPFPQGF